MGRTPTPLVIVVPEADEQRPEVDALRAKGHTIIPWTWWDADLVLGPAAHYWPPEFWAKPALLDIALKRARAKRKRMQ